MVLVGHDSWSAVCLATGWLFAWPWRWGTRGNIFDTQPYDDTCVALYRGVSFECRLWDRFRIIWELFRHYFCDQFPLRYFMPWFFHLTICRLPAYKETWKQNTTTRGPGIADVAWDMLTQLSIIIKYQCVSMPGITAVFPWTGPVFLMGSYLCRNWT